MNQECRVIAYLIARSITKLSSTWYDRFVGGHRAYLCSKSFVLTIVSLIRLQIRRN